MAPSPYNGTLPPFLLVHLNAPARDLRWRVYTVALRRVAQGDTGPKGAGWSRASLPAVVEDLPNGLYYWSVAVDWGGSFGKPMLVRWWVGR